MTLLLESGADVNIRDSNDKTPLDVALDHGRFDVARLLVEYMGNVDSQNRIDLTFLDNPPQGPPPNVAQRSLGRGEDSDVPQNMKTSLHDASEEGNLEIVQSLLDSGAYVNERNALQQDPLFCASRGGRVEVAKLLIKYGADVNFQDRVGRAPLHIASRSGHLDVVLVLLENGADTNIKTQGHWTALHFASILGYVEIVNALLRWGANIHLRNDEGHTPTQLASRRGERGIVQLLSEYGVRGV